MKRIILSTALFFVLINVSLAAPLIEKEELSSISDTSAIITWKTTNEAASTEIIYGIGSPTTTYSLSGTRNYHYLELTGLYPATTYK